MVGGLALTFVLCLATAGAFLGGTVPAAFGDALRVDGLSALVLVLCGFVGLLSGVYGVGYLRRNEARGLVTPRMRREFYGLIPAYVFAMLLVAVSNNLGILWIAVELTTLASVFLVSVPRPRHVARGGVEVPGARQPRARRSRCWAPCCCSPSGQGQLGEGMPALHWTRFMAGRAAAASLHAAARRRVRAHRLRHQGGPGADAHVEAGRLPRGAVAGGRADGRRHAERRALLRPAHPPHLEARRSGPSSPAACCWRSACCRCSSRRRSS